MTSQIVDQSRWMLPGLPDRMRNPLPADVFATALAVALPWSTSAVSICAVLWLVTVLPVLDRSAMRRAFASPAGWLPVLLVLMLAAGMLWSTDVSSADRTGGIKSLARLLLIPLLMAHYQRSKRGGWVLVGFLGSCGVLLAVSWIAVLISNVPTAQWRWWPGVPVKDYIAQANEFTVCASILPMMALIWWRAGRTASAMMLVALIGALLLNVLLVATSRTALVVIPVLVVLFALRMLSRRAAAFLLVGAAVTVGIAVLFVAPVRTNVSQVIQEIRTFDPNGPRTRAGERLYFWTTSAGFIAAAPMLGHGTGSIPKLFSKAAEGQIGIAALAAHNPHNQVLAIGIQLGLVGMAVLLAMWAAHFAVFWRAGLAAWVGLAVVAQNVVGSLFNSHLADFTQGWGYVIGVGVAAGVMLKEPPKASAPSV